MAKSEREKMFGETKSGYRWCLHCERAYKDNQYREVERHGTTYEMCHYEDCLGDAVLDTWDWAEYQRTHSKAPDKPETGKKYRQYS